MSMFATIGGRVAVSRSLRGSVIARVSPNVSVTARMTQLGWQNMFGSHQWLAQRVRGPLLRAASLVRTHARRAFPRSQYRPYNPSIGQLGTIRSAPGQIPYTHAPSDSKASLKNIQWTPSRPVLRIWVGPAYVPTRNNAGSSYRVPGILEHGGSGHSMIAVRDFSKHFYIKGKNLGTFSLQPRRVRIAKRPYMLRALNKAMSNYPALFSNLTGRLA